MTTTAFIDWTVFGFGVIIAIVLVAAYGRNLVKVVVALREQDFSMYLVIRAIGIFFPVVGVIMGFV